MQTFEEKCEALKTILPLLFAHLQRLPQSKITQSYGDSEQIPGSPAPLWTLFCRADCPVCRWTRECKGEPWEAERIILTRKYRLNIVRAALDRLDKAAPQLGFAVSMHYVEPLDLPRDDGTIRWADAGVRWMVRNMRGEIPSLDEPKRSLIDQVDSCLDEGMTSPSLIARRVGCSLPHAKRLKAALLVRRQHIKSAQG